MATIVNLRQARKVRAREERAAAAAEQRVRHGRTTAERRLVEDRLAREAASLSGHRLDEDGSRESGTLDGEHRAEPGNPVVTQ